MATNAAADAAGEKDLNYYIEHPDELPEHYSIEQIAELAAGRVDDAAKEDKPQVEEGAATGTEGEPKAAEGEGKPAGEAAKPEDEDPNKAPEATDEAPIQSKDGKHTIPYAVLSKEREQRQNAEATVQALQKRLEALEAGKATGDAQVTQSIIDEADLAELREDLPQLATVIDKLVGKIGTLEGELQAERAKTQQEVETAVKSTVQEHIDANPTLRFWQNENVDMFNKAVEFDDVIRADPKNAGLTMAERFDKVVVAMEAVYGKTELPDAYKPTAQKEPEQKPNDIAVKAKEIVDKAPADKPKTLADIPGGQPPGTDELENITELSTSRLNAMMDKMTPEQINSLLAKYG